MAEPGKIRVSEVSGYIDYPHAESVIMSTRYGSKKGVCKEMKGWGGVKMPKDVFVNERIC